jgi:hypothetical protein
MIYPPEAVSQLNFLEIHEFFEEISDGEISNNISTCDVVSHHEHSLGEMLIQIFSQFLFVLNSEDYFDKAQNFESLF